MREVHPVAVAAESSASRGMRAAAAAMLRLAGAVLDRLAARIDEVAAVAPYAPALEPVFEFYAESGAPEGALYVDGQFVGILIGVTRL